jgi:hypothetical protein
VTFLFAQAVSVGGEIAALARQFAVDIQFVKIIDAFKGQNNLFIFPTGRNLDGQAIPRPTV